MISKIEHSQIEWITNGERASALNINRPLKQLMTKYNINIDSLADELDTKFSEFESTMQEGLALEPALLTKFNKTDVVQSTGQSTEKVMSQKAITDELDAINLLIGDTSAALDAINGEVI